jgi:hypothetical protein
MMNKCIQIISINIHDIMELAVLKIYHGRNIHLIQGRIYVRPHQLVRVRYDGLSTREKLYHPRVA